MPQRCPDPQGPLSSTVSWAETLGLSRNGEPTASPCRVSIDIHPNPLALPQTAFSSMGPLKFTNEDGR